MFTYLYHSHCLYPYRQYKKARLPKQARQKLVCSLAYGQMIYAAPIYVEEVL